MMRRVEWWIAVAAVACVTGCANGNTGLMNPSPLAGATPAVPSNCAVPGTPHNLIVDVTGNIVSLSWSTVRDASDYVVLVGWTPATAESVMTNTSDANHSIVDLPSGKHYARVHAHNWCGTSDASEPVTFTVSQ